MTGIEPALSAWKAEALPLSYTRAALRSVTAQSSSLATVARTLGAPGRSVVASAPALGAGDREFESPRPDQQGTTLREICEERRREPVRDTCETDRRTAVR